MYNYSYEHIHVYTYMQDPTFAMYTLQMRMKMYHNPNGIDSQGLSCDPVGTCDTYFVFCLRARLAAVTDPTCFWQQSTESNPINSDLINPPTTGPLYTNSPINNPVTFIGTQNYPVKMKYLACNI